MKKLSVAKLRELMINRHYVEGNRKGAEFYNFGKGVTSTGIFSTTSKGGLDTEIDPYTGRCTHEWTGE